MRSPIYIAVFTVSILTAQSQSFTTYNYSIAEGLPSSEVYEVYQDKKGFLWFATDNGVVKFDGNRMTTYHTKDSLTDPVVFSFFEDHKGRLWCRTFSGTLCYFENGIIKKYEYNDKLTGFKNKSIFNFIINEKDELWFTSWDTVGRVDASGNLSLRKVLKGGVFLERIGNELLYGNSSNDYTTKAIVIDGQEFPISLVRTRHVNKVIRAIRWRGKIYLSTNREVFEYDGEKITKVIVATKPVINVSLDNEDNLWIGYLNGGVERYEANNWTPTWIPEFLKNKSVTKVIQDHEGGLWISTLENGVYHMPNLLIAHYPLKSTSRIRAVLPLNNKVITCDQGGNLFQIDSQTKETRLVEAMGDPLISIFSNGKKVFLSSSSNIYVLDQHLNFEKQYSGIANDFTTTENGRVFTFGSRRLMQFDEFGNLLKVDTIRQSYRAIHTDGTLMFMADKDLHIRNEKFDLLQAHKGFTNVKISNIQKLNDSTILLSTLGKGFMLMDTRRWNLKIFNSDNNFIADHIYSSLVTDKELWLGTEKGLIKIQNNQLYKPNFAFEYLTRKSGLINDKIDFLLQVDKSIWAFSDNSFSVIPISFSKFANKRPIFYIQELQVNGNVLNQKKFPKLLHTQNNIQITFGVISFNNQNILFRYKLIENDGWAYTANKQLSFPSLAPGQYSFKLEYSPDNVQWLSAFSPISFSIAQPWWNKWYTYVAATSMVLLFGFLYFRYQQSIYRQKHHFLKIINEHQQRLLQSEIVTLERERNRISKELHDRVGTNLSAIKLTVNQILKTHHEPMTEDIEDQFQVAIKEIKDIIYGLTPPGLERYGLLTGLKNYVGKLTKSIPLNISLKTFGVESLNYELNIIVFRVIQELLSNSIKHSHARNITIHINSFEDILNIVYEDDGIGFTYSPEQTGLGLDSIESRIRSIQGTLKFESGNFGVSYTIDIPITLNKEVV